MNVITINQAFAGAVLGIFAVASIVLFAAPSVHASEMDLIEGGAGLDFGNYDMAQMDFGNYNMAELDFGNYDMGTNDFGNYDMGQYDFGNYDMAQYDFGNYDMQQESPDFGNYDMQEQEQYTEDQQYYEEQYSEQYQQQQSYSQPFQQQSFAQSYMPQKYQSYFPSYPSYPSHPSYPSFPSYPTPKPTPVPQPHPIPQPVPQPNVTNTTTNTCVNHSCNTTITDNSINGSFNDQSINVATLTPVTPQPIIQYTIPQYPTYPTYSVQQAPYCVITITNYGTYYSQATLSWSSINATSASISGVGSVPVSGTRVVSGGNQIYTLTVWGPGGSATCQTQYSSVAPQAPYVSLSQIPYTGFDFGPVGNAIYWTALISLAAGGAYLMIFYRGGVLALASSMIGARKNEMPSATILSEEVVARAVPVEVIAAPVLAALPTMSMHGTKDSMAIALGDNGIPRLVINRA
ncbi:hypothetical protein HY970_00660 [Candidatus Kaiserbacteria bacterium]|nr:hypothetical protein [Candidatus Kaiserbacteria bacterium]